jgi:AAHS family 3-hydroxyphenylpropionic acid transporter
MSAPAIGICALVAMFEGLDIQSIGVVAPRVAKAFGASPQGMGLVLSASIMGLLIGAALGGWLSDRTQRRHVLAGSLVLLGFFSSLTSVAGSYDILVLLRLLAGFGLGGVLPNLIAITTDFAAPRWRASALALVYGGMPAGGALAAWVTSLSRPDDWRPVFLVGGIGPLLLVPLVLALASPAIAADAGEDWDRSNASLFGARSGVTLLLWLAYFFTLLTVYLLLNWLPSMMTARGLSPRDAAHASVAAQCRRSRGQPAVRPRA